MSTRGFEMYFESAMLFGQGFSGVMPLAWMSPISGTEMCRVDDTGR